jgi:L-2-hydroxycarboxylate dehydrogenase (NAD+)
MCYRAMSLAIEKARKVGMGSVAVRNSTHFGIAGYYPLMAVKENMIGMTVTNARPSIAPTFGVRPMLGTNPIAFGAPSDEAFPFLFDGATSITQRGKLEVLSRKKKSAPAGWVVGPEGNTLTDPNFILNSFAHETAALLPLGGAGEELAGHKGYGLATMVEILSASLQSGAFLWDLIGFDAQGNRRPNMLGHFFMAIDVAAFVDPQEFKHSTGEILRQLRAATLEPGQTHIFTAGEKEYNKEIAVRQHGVEILPDLQKEIKTIERELGLTGYNFPF